MRKPPAYEAHEMLYAKLAKTRFRSWNENAGLPAIEPGVRDFIANALAQPWSPRRGRAIELGCGTAPILRWLGKRGWKGAGVDISPTAIRMARREGAGSGLRFLIGDVTRLDGLRSGSFDLAVDGQCLHCLTTPGQRSAFFRAVRRVLRRKGLFVALTMAQPILPREFRKFHSPVRDGVIYVPTPKATGYAGARRIGGTLHMPTRFLAPWEKILADLRRHGFDTRLFRVVLCHPKDPLSYLAVAAVRT